MLVVTTPIITSQIILSPLGINNNNIDYNIILYTYVCYILTVKKRLLNTTSEKLTENKRMLTLYSIIICANVRLSKSSIRKNLD